MSQQVAGVLRKALEAFGPNGEHWIKHAERDGRGNFCSYGALAHVAGRFSNEEGEALAVLRKALGHNMIADWQDDGNRQFPEVKALFKKAIALAEAA